MLRKMSLLSLSSFVFATFNVAFLKGDSYCKHEGINFISSHISKLNSPQGLSDNSIKNLGRGREKMDLSRTITSRFDVRSRSSSEQQSRYAQNERKTIIGGISSSIHRFPYMVSIQYIAEGKHVHACGGSLIAPDIVLTAAHCFNPCRGVSPKIIIGDYDFTNETDGGEVFDVKGVTIHPNYDEFFLAFNDIMIFQISGNSTKTPVRLNKDSNIPKDNQEVDAIGWGAIDPNVAKVSHVLKETTLEVVPNDKCFFLNESLPFRDTAVCTADLDGIPGEGICNGDSGGPLIKKSSNYTEDIQIGLVSTGPKICGTEGIGSQYSRISSYYDWITNVVCSVSTAPPNDFDCANSSPLTPLPVPKIPASPSTKKVALTLAIRFDGFPTDVSWAIYNGTEEEVFHKPNVVYQKKNYADDLANTTVYEHLDLEPDKPYVFVINDCRGNGICCDYGMGYYFFYWGHKEQKPYQLNALFRSYDFNGTGQIVSFNTNIPVQPDDQTKDPIQSETPTQSPLQQPATPNKDYDSENNGRSSSSFLGFIDTKLITILCFMNCLIATLGF